MDYQEIVGGEEDGTQIFDEEVEDIQNVKELENLQKIKEECKHSKKGISKGAVSKVWQHFKVLNDGKHSDKAFCNHCDMPVARGKSLSPSNLVSHLKHNHKNLFAAGKLKEIEEKPGALEDFINKGAASTFKDRLIRWMVLDSQPLSVAESVEFREMIKGLAPKTSIPDRRGITSRMEEISIKVRLSLAKLLEGETLSVTLDTWTSVSNESYCSLTAHFINFEWDLINVCLGCSPFPGSHTAEAITEKYKDMLARYNIFESAVAVCVTDTAAAMKKAGKAMSCDWHGCVDHLLELVTGKFFAGPGVSAHMRTARNLVGFFKSSPRANDILKSFTTQLGIKWKTLVPDVATRWWSTYSMLASILYLKEALCALMNTAVPINAKFSDESWIVIERGVTLLRPFMVAQRVLEGESYVTLSWVPVIINSLLKGLKNLVQDTSIENDTSIEHDRNSAIHLIASAMVSDFETRFGTLELATLPIKMFIASALDPRTKQLAFLSSLEQDKVWQEILYVLLEKFDAEVLSSQPLEVGADAGILESESMSIVKGVATENEDDIDIFLTLKSDLPMSSTSVMEGPPINSDHDLTRDEFKDHLLHEIQLYKGRQILEHSQNEPGNPLKWWAGKCHLFPALSSLARIVLAIPATSAPSERVFSVAGQIATVKRNRLSPESVENLVFLKGSWKATESLINVRDEKGKAIAKERSNDDNSENTVFRSGKRPRESGKVLGDWWKCTSKKN